MRSKELKILTSTKVSRVVIKNGLLFSAGNFLGERNAVIITDDNVEGLYIDILLQSLKKHGVKTCSYSIGMGESAKSIQTIEKIHAYMYANGICRNDAVISLGGGVVGDIAGLAAATYMRGTFLVHIPTTIIAQTDSSIGGKCGVNFNGIKNMIGAFYQPDLVLIDTAVLKTLPKREFNSGMAEVIKYAAIFDKNMFLELESSPYNLDEIIYNCCKLKAFIVELDEFDRKERHILNFGHTFGHSLETASNNELSHGEAVAIGMVIASKLGERLKITQPATTERLVNLLEKFSLPTRTKLDYMQGIMFDKKSFGDKIDFVFLHEIGRAKYINLPIAKIYEAMGFNNEF